MKWSMIVQRADLYTAGGPPSGELETELGPGFEHKATPMHARLNFRGLGHWKADMVVQAGPSKVPVLDGSMVLSSGTVL